MAPVKPAIIDQSMPQYVFKLKFFYTGHPSLECCHFYPWPCRSSDGWWPLPGTWWPLPPAHPNSHPFAPHSLRAETCLSWHSVVTIPPKESLFNNTSNNFWRGAFVSYWTLEKAIIHNERVGGLHTSVFSAWENAGGSHGNHHMRYM